MTHKNSPEKVHALVWEDGCLRMLDQRLLPAEEVWLECTDVESVVEGIRGMAVRGAPAIGIAAAYGVALAALEVSHDPDWRDQIAAHVERLAQSRPTAVNLFWALERMRQSLAGCNSLGIARSVLTAEAVAIHQEDAEANQVMGRLARDLMLENASGPFAILTHCNTGALATGGYGTALGAIRSVWDAGFLSRVYADETRPWLQGARLTAWELLREGLPVVLNCDGAAAQILRGGEVKWVIVGADRITANGDVANKIGTYGLAILARHHGVGVMVVAPSSTVDMSLPTGASIPIEQRDGCEVKSIQGKTIAPAGVEAFNPVFDVTPAGLIDVIVTERGVVRRPDMSGMARLFNDQASGSVPGQASQ
ncbi:S-methyl-5-thioribose-1-phosphate isomerase [Hydrocarboniclastica marina]|uniref:Methylthioribose-1-phosphate isomerase n=1 Tax=Hydrocarboniclastica marina TaxID=2259620 RepID=A0A4P7XFS3_9ALTE|nr:S-methyl-5-thioribose-1-phosphate isomerase [Hydrocarboniclastica marina]QCF25545.1 S-methyl-5-thioribose-1-phosphate isomerase [Hydrocarboniclastica marina]